MSTSVVSCRDASPILDAGEEIFDLVTLAVELLVVDVLDLAVTQGRDAGLCTAFGKSSAESIAVIALVAQQHPGAWQTGEQQRCALVVAHLAFGEQQDDRPAQAVADGVEL